MKKGTLVLIIAISSLTLMSAAPVRKNYVEQLRDLAGQPYIQMDCQRFIEAPLHVKHCGANGMWSGCYNQAHVIAEFKSRQEALAYPLLPGDVLDFHGVHVAVYVGDKFMDSDAQHGGVGYVDLEHKNPNDLWFTGPVRIVRWNQ